MKVKSIYFILISQLLLTNSVSAYYLNTPYGLSYSYSYSYPNSYMNTHYEPLSNVSNGPRTVTIECKDNNPPVSPGTIQYDVYNGDSCYSITGEGDPFEYTNSYKFSGSSSNRICVSYYQNSQSCSIYRYDTTYTPSAPVPYSNDLYIYGQPVYNNTPIYTTPVTNNITPTCKDEQIGMTYPTVNINCSCPNGSISSSNGGYHNCIDTYIDNTVTPYLFPYTNNYNQYPITYSWSNYGLSQYNYTH